jgi:hypothetical protein
VTWSIKQYRTHTAAYRRSGRARLNIGDLRAFLIEAEEALLSDDTLVRITAEPASEGGGCHISIEASATKEIGEEHNR